MKIRKFETFCNEFVGFVRVTSDSGEQGWGQVSTYNADITTTVFHRQIAPHALGTDALDFTDTLALIGERERLRHDGEVDALDLTPKQQVAEGERDDRTEQRRYRREAGVGGDRGAHARLPTGVPRVRVVRFARSGALPAPISVASPVTASTAPAPNSSQKPESRMALTPA